MNHGTVEYHGKIHGMLGNVGEYHGICIIKYDLNHVQGCRICFMETKRNQKVNMRIRGKVKENLRKLENNLTQWNIRGKAMEKLQKKNVEK